MSKIIEERRVESHDVWTFLNEIQNAVQEGFVLSDKNEHFPFMIIGQLFAVLVKYEKETPVVETQEEKVPKELTPEQQARKDFEATIEDQAGAAAKQPAKAKPGRKPKASA